MATKKKIVGHSKRARGNAELVVTEPQQPADAVKALRKFKATKFNQTVNVVAHLGIDPKHADQALRGAITFPHGTGKIARVVAFCSSDKVAAAKAAGAVEAGAEDLVAKIEGGWMEFDVAVASPDMMRVIAKLGKVLGPKGLMPSPKAGTVTPDVPGGVKAYAAGKTEYRNDDYGNIHCIIGKLSFSDEQLTENLTHFINTMAKAKPSASKGLYFKKVCISGTMTPSVQVAV
ncbi:MAG: 50S ribosomal protein L1 [Planctomycetota bacterium]|nr:50S ribosomal protein L1 [Planctomycetota bacterium]MDA1105026.1 50S ribosomal protein L1 [Planctomycetota bacterium]